MPMSWLSPSTTGIAPQFRFIILMTIDRTVSVFFAVTTPVDMTS
jgi:hypothetical protein